MHLITVAGLHEAVEDDRDAADEIAAWVRMVRAATWTSFVELKGAFPDADDVDPCVVFNIRGNRHRLIVKVHYMRLKPDGRLSEGHVYFKAFLTHQEYDRFFRKPFHKQQRRMQSVHSGEPIP